MTAARIVGITIAAGETWSNPRRATSTANQTNIITNPSLASYTGPEPSCLSQLRQDRDLPAVAVLDDRLGEIGSRQLAAGELRNPMHPPERRPRPRTTARLRIGTLNIKGFGAIAQGGAPDKWMYINQVVRDQNLAVLAIQEAHLSEERLESLNALFAVSLKIYCSPDPENSTGARGVAYVINRRKLAGRECTVREVIPGRAMQLEYPWAAGKSIRILNVYAPNAAAENAQFWTTLRASWVEQGRAKPDVVLGDFNVVESALDRYPAHPDPACATEALSRMMRTINACDSWRTAHPTERLFTFRQAGSERQSRLDRIYVKQSIVPKVADWLAVGPGRMSDHQLVICSIANYHAPVVGKGRWSAPLSLLDDAKFTQTMRTLGADLSTRLAALGERTEKENPQLIFNDFKQALVTAARQRAKEWVPKLEMRIKHLREQVQGLQNSVGQSLEDDPVAAETVALLQERVQRLEANRFGNRRMAVHAKDWANGEKIGRYWTRQNAPPKQDSVMYEMRRPGGVGYANSTKEMCEIARTFYDDLQLSDPPPAGPQHSLDITRALECAEARLTGPQKAVMAARLTNEHVRIALKHSGRHKAAGRDGIPTEFWLAYLQWHEKAAANARPALDIVGTLKKVFNDIEAYGVAEGVPFAEGWVCPIYKKKDPREITNYRPITVLNADYKIMTKALTAKLSECASDVIHSDQAGFVPGRSIFNHIKLASLLVEYAEAEEQNGVIVALDQEKAYDRIDHTYLWAVLRHMNFPETFITTVRALYSAATSAVMVNGTLSRPFAITRGVRQGDPLSCLLFDLAIEPLAAALRSSSIRGFSVPGAAERLVSALFADDTTAFLGETDSFADLMTILERWCAASRAKFNDDKTEVLPVGSKTYRESVLRTRKLTSEGAAFPEGVKIVPDRQPVRVLGAWIGNQIDQEAVWGPMVDTVRQNLERWSLRNPSMYGRKLITGLEVGGRTQFLAKAQGMPPAVEQALERAVIGFVWKDGGRPMVNAAKLQDPLACGGLNLLDVRARNEAIDLMWLKAYMDDSPSRPTWARLADVLLANAIQAADKRLDPKARVNTFLQAWGVNATRPGGLPRDLARMVKAARKYGVRLEVHTASEDLKAAMPIWAHGALESNRLQTNSPSAKCLRERHGVLTVGDCLRVAERTQAPARDSAAPHMNSARCRCDDCRADRDDRACANPPRCAALAAAMLRQIGPKWRPALRLPNVDVRAPALQDGPEAIGPARGTPFGMLRSTSLPLANALRVFTRNHDVASPAAADRPSAPQPPPTSLVWTQAYTDGSCVTEKGGKAAAGAGVWFGKDDPRNTAARVPGCEQTNNVAEFYAVALAASLAPADNALEIKSDSKLVVDGLTSHLDDWEDRGWIGVANADRIRDTVSRLRARRGPVAIAWVKGHSGIEGNEAADVLADKGTRMSTQVGPALPPAPTEHLVSGVRLPVLTQRLAYLGIRQWTPRPERKRTVLNLERAVEAVAADWGLVLRPANLWQAIRKDDVRRTMRDFWWKALHGALRIGEFWDKIPGYEHRATCSHCGVQESLEHILLECGAPGQAEIWRAADDLLSRKGIKMPKLSYGALLASPALEAPGKEAGSTRVLRILLTESCHLVWKIRCERVIGRDGDPEQYHSPTEIRRRWMAAVQQRLELDRALVRPVVVRGRLTRRRVLMTWAGLLQDEGALPEDWIHNKGVLVGRPSCWDSHG